MGRYIGRKESPLIGQYKYHLIKILGLIEKKSQAHISTDQSKSLLFVRSMDWSMESRVEIVCRYST